MKNKTLVSSSFLSALALGMALSASAQTMQSTPSAQPASAPPDTAVVDSDPGLVGTNYSELGFGYQKQNGPNDILRDYEFVSNGNVLRQGVLGLDANFTYDYTNSFAYGFDDRRDEALLGLTGFLMQSWGKPFLTADAGIDWERAADISRKSVAYRFTGGVEFQVLRDLALSPYVEYMGEPDLYNHELPLANLPNFTWEYGVKATYRITREWKASLTADLEQYSGRDWGLRGGLSYRF